jgi:hypothetical protein
MCLVMLRLQCQGLDPVTGEVRQLLNAIMIAELYCTCSQDLTLPAHIAQTYLQATQKHVGLLLRCLGMHSSTVTACDAVCPVSRNSTIAVYKYHFACQCWCMMQLRPENQLMKVDDLDMLGCASNSPPSPAQFWRSQRACPAGMTCEVRYFS